MNPKFERHSLVAKSLAIFPLEIDNILNMKESIITSSNKVVHICKQSTNSNEEREKFSAHLLLLTFITVLLKIIKYSEIKNCK